MEESFHYLARTDSLLIEAMAVVVVAFGVIEAFVALASKPFDARRPQGHLAEVRDLAAAGSRV